MAILRILPSSRRNKLINDARHEALISALGRAIESVDDNLVGHSDKMAGVAARLADELRMDKHQKDTLLLAARLFPDWQDLSFRAKFLPGKES